MERKLLNRIKVVLAEKNKSNKWLSEQLDKDPAIISKWVTNTTQPSVEMLIQIAKALNVSVNRYLGTVSLVLLDVEILANLQFWMRLPTSLLHLGVYA